MSQVLYKKPKWQQFKQTQERLAVDFASSVSAEKLVAEILKVLTPAQFEQIAKQFGYEANV